MTPRPPLWFIFSATLAGILANTLLTPNIPDVLADLGQPDSRAGLLVASGPLPGVVVAPLIGIVADRVGRRRVLLPCLALFGVGGLAAAFSPTFEALLAARLFQGLGSAGLINLAVVLIGDHWSGAERTKLIGWNSAILTTGLAILPAVAGFVAEWWSWRASLAIASVGLPLALVGAGVLPPVVPTTRRTLGDQLRATREIAARPLNLATVVVGFFLFVVIFGVFLTTLPVHLEEQFGLGPGARGLILAAPAIGSTIAALNLARLRARFGLRPLLVASAVGVAIAAVGVGLAPTVILIVVASVVYGLADGAGIPSLQDVATSATPTAQRGAVLAVWVSAVRLGQTVGPIAASALFAATSTATTMLVGAAVFAAVAGFLAIGPIDDEAVAAASAD